MTDSWLADEMMLNMSKSPGLRTFEVGAVTSVHRECHLEVRANSTPSSPVRTS